MDEVKYFAARTSLKGIPRILTSQDRVIRAVWVFGVVGMLSITIFQTTTLVTQYLEYPVDLVVNDHQLLAVSQSERPQSVPYFLTLTVCNLDPFQMGHRLNHTPSYKEYTDYVYNEDIVYRNRSGTRRNASLAQAALDSMVTNMILSPRGYFSYVGTETALSVGHRMQEFIVECMISVLGGQEKTTIPCGDMVDIENFQTPRYFNCFSLVPKEGTLKRRGMALSGYSLVLHLGGNESDTDRATANLANPGQSLEEGGGVKFAFHRPNTSPPFDIIDQGQTLASGSGKSAAAKVKLVERVRKSEPYGPCKHPVKSDIRSLDGRQLSDSGPASTGACVQGVIAAKCGCLHPDISLVPGRHLSKQICGLHHSQLSAANSNYVKARDDITCAILAYSDSLDECFKNNYLDCHDLSAEFTFSYTKFPTTVQKPSFVEKYILGNSKLSQQYSELVNMHSAFVHGNASEKKISLKKLDASNVIEQSFMKMEFRMGDFTIHQVIDREKFTATNVLSAFGGISNIYSGITAIVVVELIEMIVRVCARNKHDEGGDDEKESSSVNTAETST